MEKRKRDRVSTLQEYILLVGGGSMDNTGTNFMTHLRPFEFTVPDTIAMYDNLPYSRDVNLCNQSAITLESGNVIKAFRCHIVNTYQI